MKRLRIGAKLTLGITFCIALSIIIGIVALINISEMKENIEEIKICKNIEIEVLECRRQEKNILLLGGYKRAVLDEKEEKTYLEKLHGNLSALRKLVGEGERKFAVSEREFGGIILVELDNYELFLKNVETSCKERKEIIKNLEAIIEKLHEFSQGQNNTTSVNILQSVSEAHAQMHYYVFYPKSEYVDRIKNKIKVLKEITEDEKVIAMADEYLIVFERLIENSEVRENNILSMRKSGRKTQQAVLKIIKIVGGKIDSAERAMIGVVWAAVILAVSFGSGISLFLSRSITKPIYKLSAATVTISKGDLSCRVAVESSDEIGELAQSFNKMTEDLERTTVSKDYVDNIIENMLDTLIAVDVDGRIKEVNKAMCKLLGYEQKALIGKPSRRLFGEKTPFEGANLKKMTEDGYLKNCEMTYLTKSKVEIPVLLSGSVIRNKEGIITGLMGMAKDLRELKDLQERLIRSENLAAMGKVASVIGHEFSNQLCVMGNSVYFLKMKMQSEDEKINKHLNILEKEIKESNQIIENILTFVKTKKPQIKTVNVKNILADSLAKVKIPEKTEVITRIDEDLPDIRADKIQIGRVFVNIILNAVQVMENKEEGKLTVKAARSGGFISLLFEDTGPGIREEDKENLFKPFFSTKPRGTGLGLSISSVIVKAHGGSIDFKSEAGKGTVMRVKLPIKG